MKFKLGLKRKFSPREKFLILLLLASLGVYLLWTALNSLIRWQNNESEFQNLIAQKHESQVLAKNFTLLKSLPDQNFTKPEINSLQEDAKVLLGSGVNFKVTSNLLEITSQGTDFNQLVLFLDKLRTSYNMFPTQLLFLKQGPEKVSFKVTFILN